MATDTFTTFNNVDLKRIAASLPDGVDQARRDRLPSILEEWARTDLQENLSRESQATRRERRRRLQVVEGRARDLLQSIEALDPAGRFSIVYQMVGERPSQAELEQQKQSLDTAMALLNRLVESQPSAIWASGRGQPRNITAYLILKDIAAIYEWATGSKASRRYDPYKDEDQESGPFWTFAKAIWLAIHGTEDGLSAAMKNWASYRARFGEESALIANIAMRNPSWRLFVP
jgi:hypothetical protein